MHGPTDHTSQNQASSKVSLDRKENCTPIHRICNKGSPTKSSEPFFMGINMYLQQICWTGQHNSKDNFFNL